MLQAGLARRNVSGTEIIQVSVVSLPGQCMQDRERADLERARAAEEHELQALDSLSASRSGSLAGSGQEGTSRLSQAYQEIQDGEKKQQLSTLVDNWLFTVGGGAEGLPGRAGLGSEGLRSEGPRGKGGAQPATGAAAVLNVQLHSVA